MELDSTEIAFTSIFALILYSTPAAVLGVLAGIGQISLTAAILGTIGLNLVATVIFTRRFNS